MLARGVRVGLGVDGSASNDGSHMLGEVRQAQLAARVREGMTGFSGSDDPSRKLMTARQALEIATRGGAAILGRPDLGSLEPGKCADFISINLNRLEYAGGLHDPVSAVVFCTPVKAETSVVGGKVVVKDGQLVTADVPRLVERHNRAARSLLNG
jgi:cytosine/adenosine deaminase-related metal-dependent hydrolase